MPDQLIPTDSDKAVRIYRVNPWSRVFVWSIMGPMLVILSVPLFVPGVREVGIFMSLFGVLVAVGTDRLVSYARLELSQAGVRARAFRETVETTWPNIARVRLDHGAEGFVTQAPMEGAGAQRMAAGSGVMMNGVPLYDAEQRRLMEERRFIPLKPFAWHLRHGDLAAEIQRFAPSLHLPEQLAAELLPKPPKPPRTPAQRRKLWLFWLTMAAILIPLILLGIFAPRLYRNLEALIWSVLLPCAALHSLHGAWQSFRRGAIFLGICLVVSALMLLCFALLSIGQLIS